MKNIYCALRDKTLLFITLLFICANSIAGDLVWYKHEGNTDGSTAFANSGFEKVISTSSGWGDFKRLFHGGGGVLYGLKKETNGSPIITSSNKVSAQEGGTVVLTVTATDPDEDTLSYSISDGADKNKFTINITGQLAFLSAPTFGSPEDADGNNVYEVTIKVDDGKEGSATQAIQVTVTKEATTTPTPTSSSGGGGALSWMLIFTSGLLGFRRRIFGKTMG